MAGLTLVLGGARSGKSRHAEGLVLATGLAPVYIATAEAFDAEMDARIAGHRERRQDVWRTVDAPHDLAAALEREAMRAGDAVLVDCLTLWLSNRLLAGAAIEEESAMLVEAAARAACPLVLVSNEVGLSIVPDNALARRFRDAQGLLNQRVAALAGRVDLVVAGLPVTLKG